MISAHIIADSINPSGQRLTTVEATFNRWILAELNTHRVFSRNSASSRAIPIKKILKQVWSDPAYPVSWGANKPGMQAHEELHGWRLWFAKKLFFWARLPALFYVFLLSKVGLHKQVANRLLEPWVWHTAIITATEWSNFFKLRLHKDAQPEFQELARCIQEAMDGSEPAFVPWGGWHLPYTDDEDGEVPVRPLHEVQIDISTGIASPARAFVSAARCARVSYVRQNERRDPAADIKMATKLSQSGHWSPFEHPAMAVGGCADSNFIGWKQLRKLYPNESGRKV